MTLALHEHAAQTPCLPTPLYSPKQVYKLEQAWFDHGYKSYALMTQVAWQMSHWIHHQVGWHDKGYRLPPRACVWTGSGNNGGDGWLIGYFLTQLGWQVTVIEVASSATEDANKAKSQAIAVVSCVIDFEQWQEQWQNVTDTSNPRHNPQGLDIVADVYIDALFGIGLDRAPSGQYKAAIEQFNQQVTQAKSYLNDNKPRVIAVDVPSGVVARTGQVFESVAIKADITLCLVARKAGLHTKDGMDYCGDVIDMPLIPLDPNMTPLAQLHHAPTPMTRRQSNTHKGSFGHVLIIGGNYESSEQADQAITHGMGGAAILAASTAMATGAGKVTVLCHAKFHPAVIGRLPNAMVMDLIEAAHAVEADADDKLTAFIQQADSVALGMGLGRRQHSYGLFKRYLKAIIDAQTSVVIDADGLYHLASLANSDNEADKALVAKLKRHSESQAVWLTPHSGEAARLLDKSVEQVEADRFDAITSLAEKFGGCWLLKGAGSLVYGGNKSAIAVCALGNAGMATAGMGDVLAGHAAAIQAQATGDKPDLLQAVMIHARAGDVLARSMGEWQLQAQAMPDAIGKIMRDITIYS